MWEFLTGYHAGHPRIRDFRGLPRRASTVTATHVRPHRAAGVPEIDYDSIDMPRGMDITIVTTASSDDHGRALLLALGFPFKREGL